MGELSLEVLTEVNRALSIEVEALRARVSQLETHLTEANRNHAELQNRLARAHQVLIGQI